MESFRQCILVVLMESLRLFIKKLLQRKPTGIDELTAC